MKKKTKMAQKKVQKKGRNRNLAKKVPRVPLKMHDENGNLITKGVFVDLKSDFGFKRIFGYPDGKNDLIRMLNAFFDGEISDIKDIVYLNTEVLGNTKRQRKALFDFYFDDDQRRHFELEMQNQPIDYMIRRSYSYTCRYHSEAMRPGKDFRFDQPPIIGIVITNFDMPELTGDSCISLHKMIDNNSGAVTTDATQILTVQLTKFAKNIDMLIDEKDIFLYLLANI